MERGDRTVTGGAAAAAVDGTLCDYCLIYIIIIIILPMM